MVGDKTKKVLAYVGFPLLFVLILGFAYIFRESLWRIFSSPEGLRHWIEGKKLASILFVLLQALQVVVFVIPGEVPQIAGGYLFGIWEGLLLSVVGIVVGSSISFYLARLLGVPFVRAIFKPGQVEKTEKIISSSRSKLAFFLLFLIPGIPKDILCYVGGLSEIKFYQFLILSTVGRLPGIVGSVIMGDAAAGKRWIFAGIIFTVAVVLFFLGFLFREKIELWLERISRSSSRTSSGSSKRTVQRPASSEKQRVSGESSWDFPNEDNNS